jgi:hypothetical protein
VTLADHRGKSRGLAILLLHGLAKQMLLKPWRPSEPPSRMSLAERLGVVTAGRLCILSMSAAKPIEPLIRGTKQDFLELGILTRTGSCGTDTPLRSDSPQIRGVPRQTSPASRQPLERCESRTARRVERRFRFAGDKHEVLAAGIIL